MAIKISRDELNERSAAILDSVSAGGERIEIEREGRVVAVRGPPPAPPGITGRELIVRLDGLRMPSDGFADDIVAARAALLPVESPAWPD